MKENANEGARRTMDAMARGYGTDKGGQYHGYAVQYERALEPLRKDGVRVVVEIVVCRAWDGNRHICPSLAMWREWSGRDSGGKEGHSENNVKIVRQGVDNANRFA